LNIQNAKHDLQTSALLSLIGGAGLLVSLIFPYVSLTFLITIPLTGLDFGPAVWLLLGASGILSVFAGYNLQANCQYSPKGMLVGSIISAALGWLLVIGNISYYYEHSLAEYGYYLPLKYELGLVIGLLSSCAIVISIILLSTKNRSYLYIMNNYRQSMGYGGQFTSYHSQQSFHQNPVYQQPNYQKTPQTPSSNSSKKYCIQCGTPRISGGRYCTNCGRVFD
jgi:putative hemolysin